MSRKIQNATNLYLEGIRDGRVREAVTKYTGERYTQHSTGVRDGIEGFAEFFEAFIKRNPKRDIQIVRSIVDGQYVFLHAYQNINDGEAKWVTTDFFDTDANDQIVEHWDVIKAYGGTTPSGHTQVDGATEIGDEDKTQANKAVVRRLIEDVLMPDGDPARIDNYISAKQFIQHNTDMADDPEPFRSRVSAENRPLNYHEIVLLVGQGNFVATLCRTTLLDQEYAQVDIFRLEDGKVVEHWDNAEPVPPAHELVNSGKF